VYKCFEIQYKCAVSLIMEFTSYTSRGRKKSGVNGFYIERNFIIVRFVDGGTYTYSYNSAGQHAVEEMKLLALESEGLCTYINQNKPGFE
jgi:hypothetical protein